MHPFFSAFEERMTFLHAEIQRELDRLPDEAFDWSPAEDMNSIAVLLTHSVGAERYWIGDVAAQESSGRVRSAEFKVTNLTQADLEARLTASMAYIQKVLPTFSAEDLDKSRSAEGYEQSFTVSWCLLHAMEHTATHVGHIQMMRHYWQHTHAG
ncbi:MAG: DinB family protein [Candidatus Promineifilaceae bacterium]